MPQSEIFISPISPASPYRRVDGNDGGCRGACRAEIRSCSGLLSPLPSAAACRKRSRRSVSCSSVPHTGPRLSPMARSLPMQRMTGCLSVCRNLSRARTSPDGAILLQKLNEYSILDPAGNKICPRPPFRRYGGRGRTPRRRFYQAGGAARTAGGGTLAASIDAFAEKYTPTSEATSVHRKRRNCA